MQEFALSPNRQQFEGNQLLEPSEATAESSGFMPSLASRPYSTGAQNTQIILKAESDKKWREEVSSWQQKASGELIKMDFRENDGVYILYQ